MSPLMSTRSVQAPDSKFHRRAVDLALRRCVPTAAHVALLKLQEKGAKAFEVVK